MNVISIYLEDKKSGNKIVTYFENNKIKKKCYIFKRRVLYSVGNSHLEQILN